MAFGFLQSDNQRYLKQYSDQNLNELLNGANNSKQQFDYEGNIFEQLPEVFGFSSGAGAWGTEIFLQADGTFSGKYRDTDMGGVGEYIYSMHLEQIELERSPGEEYFENGVKYILSDPYGFDEAEEFLIYLPGCPLSEMEEGFLGWSHLDIETIHALKDGYFGIYNVNGEKGFVGLKKGSIWERSYKYSHDGNESALYPNCYGKSYLMFWTEQGGAAAINLYFDWPENGQEVWAEESSGTGNYKVEIRVSEDKTSVAVTISNGGGYDLAPWGGTADGKLVAEYVCEDAFEE